MGNNNNYKHIRGIYNYMDKNGDILLYADGIIRIYDNGEKYLDGEAIIYFSKNDELFSKGFFKFDENKKTSHIVGKHFHNYVIYKSGMLDIFVQIKRSETKYYNMVGKEISEAEYMKELALFRLGEIKCPQLNYLLKDYEFEDGK